MNRPLTAAMVTALDAANSRWDRSLVNVDGRTRRALVRRGLVDVTVGTESYHRGNGYWVSRSCVTDTKINDAGRKALEVSR